MKSLWGSLGQWRMMAVLACTAMAATACGSSSSSTSSSSTSTASSGQSSTASAGGSNAVAEAKSAVAAGIAAPTFQPPGPAFKVAPGLSGKTIWYVANGLNFPFSENLVSGVKEAAKVVGMNVNALDGNGSPAKAASLIQEGISQKAAVIVIQSFPSSSVSEPIKMARAAGIPVVQIDDGEPGLPNPAAKADGVFANVASCYACGGGSLADLVVANTEGKADVVFIDVPDIETTLAERDEFKSRLAQLCPSCKVTMLSSPVAQWGGLGNLAGSALKSDPNVNYIVPALDAMIPIMKPAIAAANAQNRVQMSSYNATVPNMTDMKKGQLVTGLVGNPEAWMGWAVVDEALRALSHQPPVANENIPNRTFTHDSVQGVDLSAPDITWYGNPGFEQGYQKLWNQG